MATSLDQTVGVVITSRVHERHAAEFEAGLHEAVRTASQQPGWISAEVLRRSLTATQQHRLPVRPPPDLLARLRELGRSPGTPRTGRITHRGHDRHQLTGMAARFDLPAPTAPTARWRMALLTWVGIWPLVTPRAAAPSSTTCTTPPRSPHGPHRLRSRHDHDLPRDPAPHTHRPPAAVIVASTDHPPAPTAEALRDDGWLHPSPSSSPAGTAEAAHIKA
ncbi:MAG: antibiotic biosynthesis monooxygenase [Solirubrobacteraceae bacterium]